MPSERLAGRHLKRVHLELGGNSAMLVLDDADVDKAVNLAAWGSFFHQGQICMTTGRHLVPSALYDDFVEALADEGRAPARRQPGHRRGRARPGHRRGTARQDPRPGHRRRTDAGAKAAGGASYDGLFYRPTVLSEVTPRAPGLHRGDLRPGRAGHPGAPARTRRSSWLVRSEYGLSLGIITSDVMRGLALADRIPTGIVHINDQTVNDEANAPFGGVAASGTGSRFGGAPANIEAFTETRWITAARRAAALPLLRSALVLGPGSPLGSRRVASPGVGAGRGAVVRRRPVGAGGRGGRPARPGRTTGRAATPPVVDRRCARRGRGRGRGGRDRRCPTDGCRSRPAPVPSSPRRTPGKSRRPARDRRWTCRSIPVSPPTAAARCTTTAGRATPTPGPGPLGRDPEVDTAWYGLEECATLAFDQHERLVALCGDLRGPMLHVLDRDMHPLATKRLPDRPDVEGKQAVGEPLRRCLLLPRRPGPRGGRHHRRPDPRVRDLARRTDDAELKQERSLRRLRRAAGRRLPDRADAGLGGPDLVRHPGRPCRHGRPRRRARCP